MTRPSTVDRMTHREMMIPDQQWLAHIVFQTDFTTNHSQGLYIWDSQQWMQIPLVTPAPPLFQRRPDQSKLVKDKIED